MYDDEPNWRVCFNLLSALYSRHPVRIDIAGTTESIAEITADMLFECHRSFYNMSNMFICIAGNVDADAVLDQIDRQIDDQKGCEVIRGLHDEPREINTPYVEQRLAVAKPLFNLGFKEACDAPEKTLKERIVTAILLEIISGKSSSLYERLINEGLINESFDSEYFNDEVFLISVQDGELCITLGLFKVRNNMTALDFYSQVLSEKTEIGKAFAKIEKCNRGGGCACFCDELEQQECSMVKEYAKLAKELLG